jgi:hypothetical protein
LLSSFISCIMCPLFFVSLNMFVQIPAMIRFLGQFPCIMVSTVYHLRSSYERSHICRDVGLWISRSSTATVGNCCAQEVPSPTTYAYLLHHVPIVIFYSLSYKPNGRQNLLFTKVGKYFVKNAHTLLSHNICYGTRVLNPITLWQSRGSSVSILTGLWAGRPGFDSR